MSLFLGASVSQGVSASPAATGQTFISCTPPAAVAPPVCALGHWALATGIPRLEAPYSQILHVQKSTAALELSLIILCPALPTPYYHPQPPSLRDSTLHSPLLSPSVKPCLLPSFPAGKASINGTLRPPLAPRYLLHTYIDSARPTTETDRGLVLRSCRAAHLVQVVFFPSCYRRDSKEDKKRKKKASFSLAVPVLPPLPPSLPRSDISAPRHVRG